MVKILPLLANRQVLTSFCICPAPKATEFWKRLAYIIAFLSLFLANIACLAASAAFFLTHVSSNLEASLYAFCLIIAFVAATYILFRALFSRHQFHAIFESLSNIYSASKQFKFWNKINFFLSQKLNRRFQIQMKRKTHSIFWCKQMKLANGFAIFIFNMWWLEHSRCNSEPALVQLSFVITGMALLIENICTYRMLLCKLVFFYQNHRIKNWIFVFKLFFFATHQKSDWKIFPWLSIPQSTMEPKNAMGILLGKCVSMRQLLNLI